MCQHVGMSRSLAFSRIELAITTLASVSLDSGFTDNTKHAPDQANGLHNLLIFHSRTFDVASGFEQHVIGLA